MHTYIYIYIHTYIHTYLHLRIHTYQCSRARLGHHTDGGESQGARSGGRRRWHAQAQDTRRRRARQKKKNLTASLFACVSYVLKSLRCWHTRQRQDNSIEQKKKIWKQAVAFVFFVFCSVEDIRASRRRSRGAEERDTVACIRQHTTAYASICQHTSAYASIRQHTRHSPPPTASLSAIYIYIYIYIYIQIYIYT